jgi:radical SAM protein with 4Fe4S-binding SPASM domain
MSKLKTAKSILSNLKLAKGVLNNLPAFALEHINRETLLQEIHETCATIRPQAQPRLYQIETTSRCNLACPFCPRTTELLGKNVRDLNAVMPLAQFEAVLDKMPWLKSLELFHFGEPFMHNNFHEYVKACKVRGIYTVVASNLLPATPDKIDRTFEAGLDFLVMDIDSLEAERYALARVNGNLSRLQPIVKYILRHPHRPYTVAQTIQLNGKPEYGMDELLLWTGGLAPDELRYKFLDSFRGTVTLKGGMSGDDLCREPFYGFTVHVNGNVVPCDRDWAGENVMGNIFEQSVEDIWAGAKYREFRAQMKSPVKPKMCQNCPEGRLFNARSQPLVQVNMFKGAEVEA